MKRILLFSTLAFSFAANSQNLVVQNGASFVSSGSPTVVLNNTGLDLGAKENDWQNVNLVLTGNANTLLKSGDGLFNLKKIVVNKPGATVSISNNVQVFSEVQMVNGLFDLSGHDLLLLSAATITGETEATRITGPLGGVIRTTIHPATLNNYNVCGMGVFITTPVNNPTIDVVRGHKTPSGNGLAGAINRYYEFVPATNTPLNATVKFSYFDAELNGQTESLLQPMESANSGSSWTMKNTQSKDAAANFITVTGLNSLYRYTLGIPGNALPVMGLEFFVKRLNAQQVQLDWKTVQEISNKGFEVERKGDNENAFVQKKFVFSKAIGGNSSSPLTYTDIDTNSHNGKTYYRIRQTDLNGAFMYSVVRVIDGSTKTVSLTAWPVPATGFVNVRVDGNATDALQVWDAAGRMVKQVNVTSGQTVKVDGLPTGGYLLRLRSASDVVQKISMQ